jgi:hypothetical protein
MGPPKKKPPRRGVDERVRQENHFEYRWNSTEGHWYLFNPYTGETILGHNVETLDRSQSMWAPPDKFASKEAYSLQLLPQYYLSRRWGRRDFNWNGNLEGAATAIQSVYRAHQCRKMLKMYFNHRYFLEMCKFSGYYYYVDRYTSHERDYDSTWLKPLLARIGDIRTEKVIDPDDHMADGDKYSYRGFVKGPYLKQERLGKGNCERSEQLAFTVPNPFRKHALMRNDQINIDKTPLGSLIHIFDGIKVIPLVITNYTQVRAAVCGNNWPRLLQLWDEYPDQVLTRMYIFHSFSKTEIPLSGELLTEEASEALERLVKIMEMRDSGRSLLERLFILRAIHNIITHPAGRSQYTSTAHITETGDERQKALDAFIKKRLTMYNKYLGFIPVDKQQYSMKGSSEFITIRVPQPRAAEMVCEVFNVLSVLAWDYDLKEPMAEYCVEFVYYAMKKCCEDGATIINGLKIFYNLCYRCESGAERILYGDSIGLLEMVKEYHGGDIIVMRYHRKLQLALKENGWRGNVENLISMEIKGKKIPKEYLQPSPFERRFPPGFKFPLEEAEDERIAEEEEEERKIKEAEMHRLEEEEYQREMSARLSSRGSETRTSTANAAIAEEAEKEAEDARTDFQNLFSGADTAEFADDVSLDVSLLGEGSVSGAVTGRRKSVHFPDEDKSQISGDDDLMSQISALETKMNATASDFKAMDDQASFTTLDSKAIDAKDVSQDAKGEADAEEKLGSRDNLSSSDEKADSK